MRVGDDRSSSAGKTFKSSPAGRTYFMSSPAGGTYYRNGRLEDE